MLVPCHRRCLQRRVAQGSASHCFLPNLSRRDCARFEFRREDYRVSALRYSNPNALGRQSGRCVANGTTIAQTESVGRVTRIASWSFPGFPTSSCIQSLLGRPCDDRGDSCGLQRSPTSQLGKLASNREIKAIPVVPLASNAAVGRTSGKRGDRVWRTQNGQKRRSTPSRPATYQRSIAQGQLGTQESKQIQLDRNEARINSRWGIHDRDRPLDKGTTVGFMKGSKPRAYHASVSARRQSGDSSGIRERCWLQS